MDIEWYKKRVAAVRDWDEIAALAEAALDKSKRHPIQLESRSQLRALAGRLGVRGDWHEPDEQGVTAVFGGDDLDFDNAMAPGEAYAGSHSEMHVVLHRLGDAGDDGEPTLGEPIAVVNLATLFAWATGYGD